MSKAVEIDARVKRMALVTKVDEDGTAHVITQLVLEAEDLEEQDVKELARLQYKGQLRVQLAPTQGELALGNGGGRKKQNSAHEAQD